MRIKKAGALFNKFYRAFVMQRLVIVLLLIFEIPIISNAAGIKDDSFININNKNEEFASIKTKVMHIFSGNIDKATSECVFRLKATTNSRRMQPPIPF